MTGGIAVDDRGGTIIAHLSSSHPTDITCHHGSPCLALVTLLPGARGTPPCCPRGRGNSEHEQARERRSSSKSKQMLGTVSCARCRGPTCMWGETSMCRIRDTWKHGDTRDAWRHWGCMLGGCMEAQMTHAQGTHGGARDACTTDAWRCRLREAGPIMQGLPRLCSMGRTWMHIQGTGDACSGDAWRGCTSRALGMHALGMHGGDAHPGHWGCML